MTLADAIELARRVEAYGECCNKPWCAHRQGYDLARTLLAVVPVVQAAERWSVAYRGESTPQWDRELRGKNRELLEAVDALRKAGM